MKELSDKLQIPYSPLMHKLHRTGDLSVAVEWAKYVAEEKETYRLWGVEYNTVADIGKAFGVYAGCIYNRMRDGMQLEEAVYDVLCKEAIVFKGKTYKGISELAVAYGYDPSIISGRLHYGVDLERALSQPVRETTRSGQEIEYRGTEYPTKAKLCRTFGIARVCVYEAMNTYGIDFETAMDIFVEVKEKAGIPKEVMISKVPICIIGGQWYKSVQNLSNEFGISAGAINTFKHRNGYVGFIETLKAMQAKTIEKYCVDGKHYGYKELLKLGYTSTSYKTVPKVAVPQYPKLQNVDLENNCVDVWEIYMEVKEEKVNMYMQNQLQMQM